jgi:hypothetical protein
MSFIVAISGHNGLFELRHPSMITPFHAASVALHLAGTELDAGFVAVEDVLGDVTQFEFVRVDDMLAIV